MADTRPRPPATQLPPDAAGDGPDLQRTEHGVQVHEVPATTTEREFTIKRRSQTQMVIRRFMAHKLAVASLVVFVLMVTSVLVVVFNLIADVLYAVLDPRIRYG